MVQNCSIFLKNINKNKKMLKKLKNVKNAEKYRHNKGSQILDLEKEV